MFEIYRDGEGKKQGRSPVALAGGLTTVTQTIAFQFIPFPWADHLTTVPWLHEAN
mgnify:CR=1 FL=1